MAINSQYFSKEQVESGELTNFLSVLLAQSYGAGNLYNDIHIRPEDLGAFTIEWVQNPWSGEYGGKFIYIEDEE